MKSATAAALPVPVSVLLCGEPAASSATEMAAVKLATESGLKVTDTVQFALIASVAPQVFAEIANSDVLTPVSVMPLMLSAAVPLLVSVATCTAEVVPVVAEYVSDVGVSVAIGAPGAVAAVTVPLRVTACGVFGALSAT